MSKSLDDLGELGARQFVRNKVCKILLNCSNKPDQSEKAIGEINSNIVEEFIAIAKDETNKILSELDKNLN